MRSFLAPPPIMASPFVGVPVELGALIVQASLRRRRVFRDRTDPLALSDDILYDRYRLSEVIRYLIVLVGPYVGNATQRSRALTVAQCVCVSSSKVAPHVQRTLTYSQVVCCPLSLI